MWSLSNAFTSPFKTLAPVKQFELTARLGAYLSPAKEEVTSDGGTVPFVADPGLPAVAKKQMGPPHDWAEDEVVVLPRLGEWLERENETNSPDLPVGESTDDSVKKEDLDGEFERKIAA